MEIVLLFAKKGERYTIRENIFKGNCVADSITWPQCTGNIPEVCSTLRRKCVRKICRKLCVRRALITKHLLAANICCTVAASLQQICSNCVPPDFGSMVTSRYLISQLKNTTVLHAQTKQCKFKSHTVI